MGLPGGDDFTVGGLEPEPELPRRVPADLEIAAISSPVSWIGRA
jgi:hypothetical protein